MKNSYEKYIQEIWDIKDNIYKDYKKSGYKNYYDFIKNEIKNMNIKYSKKTIK